MGIRSYAQNFEDVMLWRALQNVKNGYFIDVGAQHPVKDSVTKAFSENDWRGIHVEPMPDFAAMLREDRPNDEVIQAIVSNEPGIATFYAIAGTGLSTGQRSIAEAHAAANFPYREISVTTLTLDELLEAAPTNDIHFLKIDVEGMERLVLASWRTSKRRPWIVVIEANLPGSQESSHEDWEDLILAKGYHHVYYDGLNRFYISDAHSERDVHFTLPPNIFDGFQLDTLSDHAIVLQRIHEEERARLSKVAADLERQLADLSEEAEALNQRWQANTEHRIADVRREISAKLADDHECERARAEARLDAVVEREHQALIAASAREAELTERVTTLQTAIVRLAEEAAAREQGLRSEALSREEALRREGEAREAALVARAEREAERIADVCREISAKLADDHERERTRAEARLDAVVEREHQTLIAVSAREAELTERVTTLRAAIVRLAEEAAVREQGLRSEALSREEAMRCEGEAREAALVARAEREAEHIARETATKFAERDVLAAEAAARQSELEQRALEWQQHFEHAVEEAQTSESRLRAEAAALAARLVRCNANMEAAFTSRSWKLAAPLRRLLGEGALGQPLPDSGSPEAHPPVPPAHAISRQDEPQEHTAMPPEPIQTILDFLALPARDFVSQSYLLLLGRRPTPEAQRAGERALLLGCGRIPLLTGIHGSTEAKGYRRALRALDSDAAFVGSLYQRYLGRSAEPDGLNHYVAQLQDKERSVIEAEIAASEEAKATGTLWNEVEWLVAADHRNRRWWRWRSRQQRLRNLENEVTLHVAQRENRALNTGEADLRADIHDDAQVTVAPSIQKVEDGHVSPNARRILRRLKTLATSPVEEYA